MAERYIPKKGEWFNSYLPLKDGKRKKHSASPFWATKIICQKDKYPRIIESKDFRFYVSQWQFEKVEKKENK